MDWVDIVVNILSALVVVIPLVVKLVEYVSKATKEKNWSELVRLAIEYMTAAEEMFADGATRKQWVIGMIEASAKTINYDLDEAALAKISKMIDDICDAAHIINGDEKTAAIEDGGVVAK